MCVYIYVCIYIWSVREQDLDAAVIVPDNKPVVVPHCLSAPPAPAAPQPLILPPEVRVKSYVYLYMYTCIHIDIYIYTYIHTYVYTCIHLKIFQTCVGCMICRVWGVDLRFLQ